MRKILYNVTSFVSDEIHEEWFKWMKNQHIPEVMATGLFLEYKFLKLIDEESEHITYAVQYYLQDIKDFLNYTQNFAPALQKQTRDKYGDKVVAHRTLLEVIE